MFVPEGQCIHRGRLFYSLINYSNMSVIPPLHSYRPPTNAPSQCLVLPRHHNDTLLATALTALDHCQNGTTSFPAINITRSEAPKIIEGFIGNGTLGLNSTERHANRTKERKGVQNAVVWNPCPTTLFFPETTSGGRRLGGDLVVVFVGFVGIWGVVNGLGW